ncbi:unnamed protein product [Allacma fusca]|uniref:Uncharacterized protein n=1 Tax=Allacma fusca TaxID=39272 RepID=A0A8J2KQB4_9HEXA|nr:unnamed protein product [Allacma fusca]
MRKARGPRRRANKLEGEKSVLSSTLVTLYGCLPLNMDASTKTRFQKMAIRFLSLYVDENDDGCCLARRNSHTTRQASSMEDFRTLRASFGTVAKKKTGGPFQHSEVPSGPEEIA